MYARKQLCCLKEPVQAVTIPALKVVFAANTNFDIQVNVYSCIWYGYIKLWPFQ